MGDQEGQWGHRGFEPSMLVPSVVFDFLSIAKVQEKWFFCRVNAPDSVPYRGRSFAIIAGGSVLIGFWNILKITRKVCECAFFYTVLAL